jgi:hypothetical protein
MISIITYINYKSELEHFDKELLSKMQLCNYSLDCKEFQVAFVPKSKQKTYTLLKSKSEISALFPIRKGEDFYLKLFYTQNDYHQKIHFLHKKAIYNFLIWMMVILVYRYFFLFILFILLRNAL